MASNGQDEPVEIPVTVAEGVPGGAVQRWEGVENGQGFLIIRTIRDGFSVKGEIGFRG